MPSRSPSLFLLQHKILLHKKPPQTSQETHHQLTNTTNNTTKTANRPRRHRKPMCASVSLAPIRFYRARGWTFGKQRPDAFSTSYWLRAGASRTSGPPRGRSGSVATFPTRSNCVLSFATRPIWNFCPDQFDIKLEIGLLYSIILIST